MGQSPVLVTRLIAHTCSGWT